MSAWICHQRPESASCAFLTAVWSNSEGQVKSGTSPATFSSLGCDATGWPQLCPTSPNIFLGANGGTFPDPSPSVSLQSHRPTPWSRSEGASMTNGPASVSVPTTGSTEDRAPSCLPSCWCVFILDRTSPADPSSDWYAPVEHWGNYEGASVMVVPPVKQEPAPHLVSLKPVCCMLVLSVHIQWHRTSDLHVPAGSKGFVLLNFQASEPENREDPSAGAARAKKRRRRKKNTEEEGASDAQVRWHNVRFLLPLASARCFVTKVIVWKQTAKLGAAPADIPAPASKKQNPSISSSQSRCQRVLLSPGLNMHFYPSFNSCGGCVSLQRGPSRARSLPNPPRRKRPAGKSEARTQDQMQMIVRHGTCNNYQTLEIVSE